MPSRRLALRDDSPPVRLNEQNGPVRIHVLGVRGSTPSPGRDFVRYGGHTSCLALAHDGEAPSLLVDAGTGIRRASTVLAGPFRGAIILGHLHWDHTQGLPFFAAGDHPDAKVTLYAPAQPTDLEGVLARAMSPPNFPITPSELRGEWSFVDLEQGRCRVQGFSVLALEIPHKGGRTFGYRISDGQGTLAYISDHCPTAVGPGPAGLGEYHRAATKLAQGCDVLFHDAQFTDEELPARATFGHAAAGYALGLALATGVKRLVLYHHDPARTDRELDRMVDGYRGAPLPVEAAAEGDVIDLAP